MKHAIVAVIVFASATLSAPAQDPQPKPLAGWFGAFPEIFNYSRQFEKPKIAKDSYEQTARYDWTGGRLETIQITLIRDAEMAKMYTPAAIKALPVAPKAVTIDKHDGYLFAGGKLVIPLGQDRLVKLEAPTFKQHPSDLTRFAGQLKLEACAKALDSPPRTDGRTLERFRALKKGMSLDEVAGWVGHAEKDIGRGIHIMTYKLDDGARVLIGFPDFKGLIYVKHESKEGKVVDLAK